MALIVKLLSLSLYTESARENARGGEPFVHSILHNKPYLKEKLLDISSLTHIYVLGNTYALTLTDIRNLGKRRLGIYVRRALGCVTSFNTDISAANTHNAHRLFVNRSASDSVDVHRVFVREITVCGIEHDLAGLFARNHLNSMVGTVSLACICKRTEQNYAICIRIGVFTDEYLHRPGRSHGVTARRSFSYFIYVPNRFHRCLRKELYFLYLIL